MHVSTEHIFYQEMQSTGDVKRQTRRRWQFAKDTGLAITVVTILIESAPGIYLLVMRKKK